MRRVRLLGIDVDAVRRDEAVELISGWTQAPEGELRYVVTPNVQHAMLFQHDADFRAAYAAASLVIVDGTPLVWASKLFGDPVPERVAGSDLVPQLLANARSEQPLSLFLLGGAPGVGERASAAIARDFPNVRVVGLSCPPLGFEHQPAENARVVAQINEARADLLLVCLGAPKQELWTYRFRKELRVKVAICAGATVDFLAGERKRAPAWMRGVGLEWTHRLMTEPRRLGPRYFSDALRLPPLLWREWRGKNRAR